jgi:DNA polymerase III delta prime subunit
MFSAEFSDREEQQSMAPAGSSRRRNCHISDEDEELPRNPSSVGIESPPLVIAGMDEYIRKLKEMIVFPLLYPEVFVSLGISPPRGVLFHGPPGTGKTLLARLLAESCTIPGSKRKVSFFMKNGSDCLSKWIGEAEKNMRLLFKKAREQQPSIIFFDEIDGLAPERTGKQDQSHISLVATLLALMDGLDDRGNVVVIGATNRINSIDPALRRPGRFDREFFFDLPKQETRRDILRLHTSSWSTSLDSELLEKLAQETADFSGADLKALCVEAALRAMRRACPRAYDLHLPPAPANEIISAVTNLSVSVEDFQEAFKEIVPSTKRKSLQMKPLTGPLQTLFSPIIKRIFECTSELIYTQSTLRNWIEDGRVKLAQPIIQFCLTGSFTISQSHLQRIIVEATKNIAHLKVVNIDLADLITRPLEGLSQYLRELLPVFGGIMQIAGLGSMTEELSDEFTHVLRQWVNGVFYHDSSHLLILLDGQQWDAAGFLNLDWNLNADDLILRSEDVHRYLEHALMDMGVSNRAIRDVLSVVDENFSARLPDVEILVAHLQRSLIHNSRDRKSQRIEDLMASLARLSQKNNPSE